MSSRRLSQDEAATIVQKNWRGYKARSATHAPRASAIAKRKSTLQSEWTATAMTTTERPRQSLAPVRIVHASPPTPTDAATSRATTPNDAVSTRSTRPASAPLYAHRTSRVDPDHVRRSNHAHPALTENDAAIVIQKNWRGYRHRAAVANHSHVNHVGDTADATTLQTTRDSIPVTRLSNANRTLDHRRKLDEVARIRAADSGTPDNDPCWCCCCVCGGFAFDALPLKDETDEALDPKAMLRMPWSSELMRAPCDAPTCCVLATLFPCCFAAHLRSIVLAGRQEHYRCCAGQRVPCCDCSLHHSACINHLEAFLCLPCAVGSTRAFYRKDQHLLRDDCDNRIIRISNLWGSRQCCFGCCDSSFADRTEERKAVRTAVDDGTRSLSCLGYLLYCSLLPCMQTQVYIDVHNAAAVEHRRKLRQAHDATGLSSTMGWWGAAPHDKDADTDVPYLRASSPLASSRRSTRSTRRSVVSLVSRQPRRSNRIHPLHPLSPTHGNDEDVSAQRRRIPDPSRQPTAKTQDVHALWATSFVNRDRDVHGTGVVGDDTSRLVMTDRDGSVVVTRTPTRSPQHNPLSAWEDSTSTVGEARTMKANANTTGVDAESYEVMKTLQRAKQRGQQLLAGHAVPQLNSTSATLSTKKSSSVDMPLDHSPSRGSTALDRRSVSQSPERGTKRRGNSSNGLLSGSIHSAPASDERENEAAARIQRFWRNHKQDHRPHREHGRQRKAGSALRTQHHGVSVDTTMQTRQRQSRSSYRRPPSSMASLETERILGRSSFREPTMSPVVNPDALAVRTRAQHHDDNGGVVTRRHKAWSEYK